MAYGLAVPQGQTLIVLGATGDLTGRLLLPAVVRLYQAEELSPDFRFIGAGPQSWDLSTFRDYARTRLATFAPDLPASGREAFLATVGYHQVDVTDPASIGRLLDTWANTSSLTIYLALPTHLVTVAVASLRTAALPATVRVAVEKPFGSDLASAVALNVALARATSDERNIFRVDHILGMPTVQELPLTLPRIDPGSIGSSNSDIAEISILWEETLALEGRAAFYDRAGALKDLLQNHLLQLLCLVIMDAKVEPDGGDLSHRRLKALRAVEIPTTAQARLASRRARYTAGVLARTGGANGTPVPDYTAEDGVNPSRATETLAEVVLRVTSPHWSGTRFVLRAGKALGQRRRGLLIRFQQPTTADRWIDLDLDLDRSDRPPAEALIGPAPLEQLAYVNVLRNLLEGSNALSVSAEETELAWRVFAPILEQWTAGTVPLESYPAGTNPTPTAGIRPE